MAIVLLLFSLLLLTDTASAQRSAPPTQVVAQHRVFLESGGAAAVAAVRHSCPKLIVTEARDAADASIRIERSTGSLTSLGFTLNKPWMYSIYSAHGDLLSTGQARSPEAAAKSACRSLPQ